MYLEAQKEEMDNFLSHFVKYWIAYFVWNQLMFDVRLNAKIKCTSGINLEGPEKFWTPQKHGPIAPMPPHSSYIQMPCTMRANQKELLNV